MPQFHSIDRLGEPALEKRNAIQVRREAIRRLRERGDSSAIEVLLRLLNDEAELPELVSASANALSILQLTTPSLDVIDDLCRLLNAVSPDVRVAALTALGNIGAQRAVPTVALLLGDSARASSGKWVDGEAARVIRLLRGDQGTALDIALRASSVVGNDDWQRLRDLCQDLLSRGEVALLRRIENAQFMTADEVRGVCFNYWGRR